MILSENRFPLFAHHALKQRPLLCAAALARLFSVRLRLPLAGIGMSSNMAIGELDVESSARPHRGLTPEQGYVGVAHERKAARHHIVVTARREDLSLAIEPPP